MKFIHKIINIEKISLANVNYDVDNSLYSNSRCAKINVSVEEVVMLKGVVMDGGHYSYLEDIIWLKYPELFLLVFCLYRHGLSKDMVTAAVTNSTVSNLTHLGVI